MKKLYDNTAFFICKKWHCPFLLCRSHDKIIIDRQKANRQEL